MHSTTTAFDSASLRDFDPARDVPESLRQYLTTVHNPRDIYVDRTHASERRLRLLHRRFLNQITYGCRNPYCNVPTCFSYRKRVSGAAVRPYTDVSARALATKCVEQYATHGRDLSRGSRRDYGKTKSSLGSLDGNLHNDGLCRNDPIIPWYADPDEYLDKIRAATSKDGRSRRYSAPRRQSTASEKQEHHSNGHVQSPRVSKSNGSTQLNQSSEHKTNPIGQQETSTLEVAGLDKERSPSPEVKSSVSYTRNEELPDAAGGIRAGRSQRLRNDHASFVQSIFSRNELRKLDQLPDGGGTANALQEEDNIPARHSQTVPEQPASSRDSLHSHTSKSAESSRTAKCLKKSSATGGTPQQTMSGTVRPAYTFKLLPPSAILWLRNMLINRSEHIDPPISELSTPNGFDHFVEQSLYFVLSDARRLLASARTWDDYVRFREKEDDDGIQLSLSQTIRRYKPPGDGLVRAMQAATGRKLTANNVAGMLGMNHPDWTSVLQVVTDLIQFVPGDQGQPRIMSHTLRAIEQGFIVPSWMKNLKISTPTVMKDMTPLTNDEVARLIALVLSMAATMQDVVPDLDALENERSTMDPCSADLDQESHVMGTNRKAFSRSLLWDIEPSCDPAEFVNQGFMNSLWPYDRDFAELFTGIANLISFRIALDATRKVQRVKPLDTVSDAGIVKTIVEFVCSKEVSLSESTQLLQFMLAVLLVKWDRSPIIRRAGPVGGALEMLKGLYQVRERLGLNDSEFWMSLVEHAFDETEMPYEWLSFRPDATRMHILQYAFLFPPVILVRYFRSLNFKIMKLSHEKALEVSTNAKAQMVHARWSQPNRMDEVLDKVRPRMSRYFVLTIGREHVLEDAIGQIWYRERQELTRPLRVRLGEDKGEEGLDHGGVQQEFFRLVFAEAFDVRYGMFTTDPTTRMTWFRPGSLEPLYKYEALGILMSLAIFNGVTLPITMPLAFYRKILGLKVKEIKHIEDGWPELAKSFEQLLSWDDGDVGDVIGRTYEFTYEAFGTHVNIDMSKKSAKGLGGDEGTQPQTSRPEPQYTTADVVNRDRYLGKFADLQIDEIGQPTEISSTSSPSSSQAGAEAPLVTNDNRDSFVKDYIKHLTDVTIAPQFTAFLRGLHTLLSPRSLALFTPSVLKQLVQGQPTSQPLNINDWRQTTELLGFLPSDPIIHWFWDILANDFNQSQLRALLAFVTASDRIPVGGWDGVIFIIQRNGDEDGRLPTSQTCYGRLLLPEYSSREVLKGRLEWAVDNSWGFWMA
ncbi:hypothetical protein OHC33_009054 [Knufia fluminis]|uniref:HECT-type E3 ubiquitin transferase n=1 Tax=Knufia fluminis TaxID=191047 RepID=A0AAN8E9N6_9EURO|nr:hypothetical protein OHC33_009054 [Knufia fluminis]